MFRKAAIVLALAASFLGAQATDLPKSARELTGNKNKTKTGSTKPGNNVRAKAKTAQLCLGGAWNAGIARFERFRFSNIFSLSGNFEVFDCATITADEPAAIGVAGFLCTYPLVSARQEDSGSGLAPCTGELTMFTDWHKTSSLSSFAMSFWTSTEAWFQNNNVDAIDAMSGLDEEELLEGFDIVAPVITGTTGAWPSKVGAFSNVGVTYVDDDLDFPYILNIAYKGRGWNPTYAK